MQMQNAFNVSLSKTLQRYENKSKSQLLAHLADKRLRCLRLCKDTKIKANHNIKTCNSLIHRVV